MSFHGSDEMPCRSRRLGTLRSVSLIEEGSIETGYCSSPDSAVVSANDTLASSSESINVCAPPQNEDCLQRPAAVYPKRRNYPRHRRWRRKKQDSVDSCYSLSSTSSTGSSEDSSCVATKMNCSAAPDRVPTAVVRNTLDCPIVFPPGCHPAEWNEVQILLNPHPYPLPHTSILSLLQRQQQQYHCLRHFHHPQQQQQQFLRQQQQLDSITIDITGRMVAYSVDRVPPLSSGPTHRSRQPLVLPKSPLPPPTVLMPSLLRHCDSLKTCVVPFSEFSHFVSPTPPHRQWRQLSNATKDGHRFTLMCYNVLSPNYATNYQYPYCPTWAIDWEYRRRGILEELKHYAPSLICLQEIDTDQFEGVFAPELARNGYEGVFLAKSRSRTMDPAASRKVDGCAIFWLTEKFAKVAEFHHEFMLSCSNVSDRPADLLLNRVMTRDNVAIDVVLETKGPTDVGGGRKFCVSTGHIHWDPEHSDVKMIQAIMWTAELWANLEQFGSTSSSANNKSSASRIPVIFCGDFNSLPNSGVVEFLSEGAIPKSHVEFLDNGFNYEFEDWKTLEKWAIDGDILRHRFNFDRAYRNGEAEGMKVTNMTYEFKGMIDYIFYTRQHFRLLGSLDQIPESWFVQERILGCPYIHVPSDHFPLLVELDMLAQPLRGGSLAISDPPAIGDPTDLPSSSSGASTNSPKPKSGGGGGGKKQGSASAKQQQQQR